MKLEESKSEEWKIMARYIAGEMEDDEKKEFQKRLDFSSESRNLIDEVISDLEMIENYKKNNNFDPDKAWDKLHLKFENDGLLDNVKISDNQFNFRILLRIAAVLLIGVLFSTVAYYLISEKSKINWMVADTYQNTNNSKIVLADGSVVYLNANSKLYYPEKFGETDRTIEFEGDAFFEITKNPQKPFVIKAKGAEIRVLGTSFNVNTNVVSKEIEVLVETGKVKLSSLGNKENYKVLMPGYIGAIKKHEVSVEKNTDKNYLSWRTKKFDFNENIKLGNAVEILNRAYHTNIRCGNELVYNKILNTQFDNDPLDKILNLICSSFSLKKNLVKDEIILSMN